MTHELSKLKQSAEPGTQVFDRHTHITQISDTDTQNLDTQQTSASESTMTSPP